MTGSSGQDPAGRSESAISGLARVAVVIVNTNGGEYLDRALRALEKQSVRPARIIVVDNASTDGSADGLEHRHSGIEVVRESRNVGFAAANNLAVRMADDCDWVALLNPDAFPKTRWLEALLAAAQQNPAYSFFGSRVLRADAPELDGTGDCIHVSGMVWSRDRGQSAEFERPAGEIFAACAAAALYRRDAFLKAGGFDESFFVFHEDSDLSFRLQLNGHRCLYVPDAAVEHVGAGLTGRLSDFTLYLSFRNQVWMWSKNMPLALVLLYLPQHVLVNALNLLAFLPRGRARVVMRAQRDALRGLPRVLRERRQIQTRRATGPLEIRRRLERGISGYLESPSVRDRRLRSARARAR